MNALGIDAMRLLLVEDNDQLAHWLAKILRDDGFMLDHVNDGEAADAAVRTMPYDVVLLDLNLPHLSGKSVLRRMRERGDTTPVLILTATGAVDEKVVCLGAGADDYIVKPFDARELVARVKVLARRQSPSRSNRLKCGNLSYDMDRCQFAVEGEPLTLTPREDHAGGFAEQRGCADERRRHRNLRVAAAQEAGKEHRDHYHAAWPRLSA
jgi:two-component system response regulator TctD